MPQDVYDLAHVTIALRTLERINPCDSSVIEPEWHNDVVEMLQSWEEQLRNHLKSIRVQVP